ncbi:hypothetical protein AKO1_013182 [Acrasis kona]|uniref:Auxin efflux carrier n=1 Tax=Acrasis kona TaxID=1008807 RepID=A0AAW2YWV4_9EUKA
MIIFGISYQLIGFCLSRFTFIRSVWGKHNISKVDQHILNCSVMFNNANSLPFIFVLALVNTGEVFDEMNENPEELAIAYVSVFLLPTRFLFWSYSLYVFKYRKDDEEEEPVQKEPVKKEMETRELLDETSLDELDRDEEPVRLVLKKKNEKPKEPFPLKGLLQSIFSPPIIGMLVGLMIGLITPIKQFLIVDPPVIISIFSRVLETFGGAMFPVSMMILGGNLYNTLQQSILQQKQSDKTQQGTYAQAMYWIRANLIKFNHPFAVLMSCFLKLVMMPMIAVTLVLLAIKVKLIGHTDPILLIVLMIEGATPCPMNLAIAANLANKPKLINTVCEIMLFQYILSPITMSICATGFLSLACRITGNCNLDNIL